MADPERLVPAEAADLPGHQLTFTAQGWLLHPETLVAYYPHNDELS